MRTAAAPLLALLAACGPSAERKLLDTIRNACNGFVAGGASLQAVAQSFGEGAYLVECALAPQEPLQGGVDQCDYQAARVCQVFWVWYAYDQSLCGPPGLGGCFYWCEVRVPGGVEPLPADAKVCGARFVSGQPCPPYAC